MKKLIFILALLMFTPMMAQEEWGNVDKNKVTMREIAPIWPGCEEGSASERDVCFKRMLGNHIAKNFKYPAEAWKNNEQGRVVVEFFVTETGGIDIKNVSGGTAALQEEAKRNIMSIPQMAKPGMMAGKPRAIKYTVPITFKTGK